MKTKLQLSATRVAPMLLTGLAFGIGWRVGASDPVSETHVKPSLPHWEVPEIPVRKDQATQAVELLSQSLIDAGTPKAPAAPEALKWRIAGIYGVQKDRHAIVVFLSGGREPARVNVGANLPDGRKVIAIDDSGLVLRAGKAKEVLKVGYES